MSGKVPDEKEDTSRIRAQVILPEMLYDIY